MGGSPFEVADPLVLKGLLLGVYGILVAFLLLRAVNLYLDGAVSGFACVLICFSMTVIFIFFAAVHLTPYPWWGMQDPLMKAASIVLVVAIVVMPNLVKMFRQGTDRQIIKGRDQRAIEQALLDLQKNPTNPAPHMVLADIYERQGRITEAVIELESALKKAPFLSQARARLNKLRGKV